MHVRTVISALFVAAAVLVAPPQAQAGAVDPGSYFVSGQLGFNYYIKSTTSEDSPVEGLDLLFAPRVLYFPTRGIGVGGEANLYTYSNSSKQTNLAIGPRVAYYLKSDASHYGRGCCMLPPCAGRNRSWMPFFGVSAMYLMDRTSSSFGYSWNRSGYGVRAGLGAAPVIGEHGTAFLELGFQTQSLKASGEASGETSNKIYLEGGFGCFLFK